MLPKSHTSQEVPHLLGTHNDGKLLRLSPEGDHFRENPILLEGDLVEKAKRSRSDMDRASCQILFVGEIQLVGPNLLRA
jgi:hypothetical protein